MSIQNVTCDCDRLSMISSIPVDILLVLVLFALSILHVYFFLPHLLLLNKSKTNGWIEKWYFHRFWFYKEIYIQSVMGSCGTQTWSIHLCFQYTFPYILYKIINVQAKPICSFIFCLAHHPFRKCDMNVSAVKVRSIYSK